VQGTFFEIGDPGLNSGPHALLGSHPYFLGYSASPYFVMGYFKIGFPKLFSLGLASNCNPSDFCLLNSYYYRHEPLVPGWLLFIK
jgi:hypothetical protein